MALGSKLVLKVGLRARSPVMRVVQAPLSSNEPCGLTEAEDIQQVFTLSDPLHSLLLLDESRALLPCPKSANSLLLFQIF